MRRRSKVVVSSPFYYIYERKRRDRECLCCRIFSERGKNEAII